VTSGQGPPAAARRPYLSWTPTLVSTRAGSSRRPPDKADSGQCAQRSYFRGRGGISTKLGTLVVSRASPSDRNRDSAAAPRLVFLQQMSSNHQPNFPASDSTARIRHGGATGLKTGLGRTSNQVRGLSEVIQARSGQFRFFEPVRYEAECFGNEEIRNNKEMVCTFSFRIPQCALARAFALVADGSIQAPRLRTVTRDYYGKQPSTSSGRRHCGRAPAL